MPRWSRYSEWSREHLHSAGQDAWPWVLMVVIICGFVVLALWYNAR